MVQELLGEIEINAYVVKTISKINEYKGKQVLYNKQPKDVLENLNKETLEVYNDKPFIRNLIGTINSSYEDMEINSKCILELYGYINKGSNIRDGKHKDIDNIKRLDDLCEKYNKLVIEDKVDSLILTCSFILDFIILRPFNESNKNMTNLLLLLILNKNGFDIGKYINISSLFNEDDSEYILALDNYIYSINNGNGKFNKWMIYVLEVILEAYEELDDRLNINERKKETKTSRIEKIINSNLGYFTKEDVRILCPDIPEPTINRVFNTLRKNNKIEVVARGRSAKWKKKY